MEERKYQGNCWRELALTWALTTDAVNNIGLDSDYYKIECFLYILWKRTVFKEKSFIRKRVAQDLREYFIRMSEREDDVYKYMWESLSYIKDDNELIKISIVLVPYMWY